MSPITQLRCQFNGVTWNGAENLHATIVNCTLPNGRSQKSKEEVLKHKAELKAKFTTRLIEILHDTSPFEIEFEEVQCKNSILILPCKNNDRTGELKRALQGNEEAIPKDKARVMLSSLEVIGRDKFSGESVPPKLHPSVSVTLGKIEESPNSLPKNIVIPHIYVPGLRVVFYRDRELHDAEVSEMLHFSGSESEGRSNFVKLNEVMSKLISPFNKAGSSNA